MGKIKEIKANGFGQPVFVGNSKFMEEKLNSVCANKSQCILGYLKRIMVRDDRNQFFATYPIRGYAFFQKFEENKETPILRAFEIESSLQSGDYVYLNVTIAGIGHKVMKFPTHSIRVGFFEFYRSKQDYFRGLSENKHYNKVLDLSSVGDSFLKFDVYKTEFTTYKTYAFPNNNDKYHPFVNGVYEDNTGIYINLVDGYHIEQKDAIMECAAKTIVDFGDAKENIKINTMGKDEPISYSITSSAYSVDIS